MWFHRLSGLALAGFLFAAPAVAQQGAPAKPASPTQPAASPKPGDLVPIPQATPAHLAAARELVMASGLGFSIQQSIPSLMGQINSTVTRTRPELVADMKTTLDELTVEFVKLADGPIDVAAKIYTAVLTEQQCKDALAFFKTPTGVKFVDSQPTIVGNLNPVVQAWTKDMSFKMLERVREEMKKKGREF